MKRLETYQAYANKCAAQLGIEHVVIQWANSENGCKLRRGIYAHCHISNGKFPRGTICLSHKYFANFSVKQWHHTIAHEVVHLAIKSAHNTHTFDRRMVALGVANDSERLNARSARKGHHHIICRCIGYLDGRTKQCRICGKHNGVGGALR